MKSFGMRIDFPNGRKQRGVTLPMTALFILILFTFAALAVDVGILYTAQTSAQHAADAAALAGAFSFVDNTVAADPVAYAADAAKAVALQNKILGKSVDLSGASVVAAGGGGCPQPTAGTSSICVDTAKRRVTVTVAQIAATSIQTYFAKLIHPGNVPLVSYATAEAARQPAGLTNPVPLYMPEDTMSSKSCTDAKASGETLFNADGTLTTYAKNAISNGTRLALWGKAADAADQTASRDPSQRGLIQFPGAGNKENGLDCVIQNGLAACGIDPVLACSTQNIGVYPGQTVGNVRTPLLELISDNRNGNNRDIYSGPGDYIDGTTGMHKDTSPSLITVVVQDCSVPVVNGPTAHVTVAGFATIFVDNVDNQNIYARLINASSCGAGGVGGTGPFSVPVRLVQTPNMN